MLIILGIVRAVSTFRVRMNMPPGPSGIPLLGNILQVPRSMPCFKFTEWKGKYGMFQPLRFSFGIPTLGPAFVHIAGPIFTLNMAGNFVVVVSSLRVAADLLGA